MAEVFHPEAARKRAAGLIARAGIRLRPDEMASLELADFGLGDPSAEGAQILTLVASPRLTAKLIVLFPGQTLPEHWHPPMGQDPGKEETVRVFWGSMSLCTPGDAGSMKATIPAGKESFYTCRRERLLAPGDQAFLPPGTKHWFQAGPEGVVAGSFASASCDTLDRFTDPGVVRRPKR
jgi:D-lyxose ketol-isomerase